MRDSRGLRMVVRAGSAHLEVALSGMINEAAHMEVDEVPAGRAVMIDCGGVLGINSFGVRTWVNFLTAVCERAPTVTLTRMPPVLVNQASMVLNFLASARVESFFTPWCCLDCSHEELQLHNVNATVPSERPCPECSGEMEFDGVRSSYLAFRDDLAA